MKKVKELTKAEEEVMFILWEIGKGFVKDIVDKFEEPKPAYNTVSTIIRILEKKEIVGHNSYGKTYEYYPLISKEEYSKFSLKNLVSNYFSNSYKHLVSFFAEKENLSVEELEELKLQLDRFIKERGK